MEAKTVYLSIIIASFAVYMSTACHQPTHNESSTYSNDSIANTSLNKDTMVISDTISDTSANIVLPKRRKLIHFDREEVPIKQPSRNDSIERTIVGSAPTPDGSSSLSDDEEILLRQLDSVEKRIKPHREGKGKPRPMGKPNPNDVRATPPIKFPGKGK